MLYKVNSMGYFGGYSKVSRGPWFKEFWVEDDGLDWYYTFLNADGAKQYLLSNNIALEDRQKLSHLYHTQVRNNRIAWVVGLFLGVETITNIQYFKQMALGWRMLSLVGLGWIYKVGLMEVNCGMYGPVMGAYLRKYQKQIKGDLFEIKDPKKEYFYIDTSDYMTYSNKTLGEEYHCHHGPQPDGESLDASWLHEVDLFLKGEENHLKEHPKYYNYNFQFIDKSFPSAEAVKDLIHKQN